MSPTQRLTSGHLRHIAGVLVVFAVVGVSGCGGESAEEHAQTVPLAKLRKVPIDPNGSKPTGDPDERNPHPYEGPPGRPVKFTTPGEIVSARDFTMVGSAIVPVNEWRIGDHRHSTAVTAGAVTGERSTGILSIYRMDYIRVKQRGDAVQVPGSGPLRITKAPTGRGPIQTTSQREGVIRFANKRGDVSGSLDLRDDSLHLDR